jgi:cytochrome c biogenesis protein CcdA
VLGLLVVMVSVGLADGLNPSTVGPALVMATAEDAVARLLAFTFGVFAVSTAGGVVLLLGPGQALRNAIPHPGRDVRGLLEAGVGVVLLVLAAVAWLTRDRLQRRLSPGDERRGSTGRLSALALGAGIMAVELPTTLPYFGAIAAIVEARVGRIRGLLFVLAYNIAFVAPLLAITAIRAIAGDEARGRLEALRDRLARHAGAILAGLLGAGGLALLATGLANLVFG